jgi:predicted extracellular nuclease
MHRRLPTVSVSLCLAAGVLMLPAPASAQSTELFFSEYIEGTSNNKALEVFNATGAAVNLAAGGYSVHMHFNGSPAAGLTINLTGTVAAGDVYVLAQSSADAAILALADQTNGSGWFNGDDAVVLRKGAAIIDVIGQIGFRPVPEWGSGPASTQDNTLRRKTSISGGDAVANDAFDPSVEWDGFATNTFSGLGSHNVDPPILTKHIWEIQGNDLLSPYAGALIRTVGIVTAAFPAAGGFFMQAPEGGDGAADTSDGLFVFTGGASMTVAAGDKVQVTGEITEFFNMTEMVSPSVVTLGSGLPIPAPVMFNESTPSPDQPQPATEMERYESMLVQVVDGLVSSPTNQFGEASVVAAGVRPFREPGILFPGLPGLPVWDGNPEIFEIDTDLYEVEPQKLIAAGSMVTAVGPLAFSFSDYQIWPTVLDVTGSPAAVPVRARDAGEFTVGSQNFLRLFDRDNDPDTSDDVPTDVLYGARLRKLSLYVLNSLGAPDLLAVQEVENLVALQAVADRIRLDDPTIVYSAHLEEGNDIGGIDVGFLVRETVRVDSIEQTGKDTVFSFPGVPDTPLNDRPPLVLRGAYSHDGALFPITVINVHQRSLSGVEAADGRVRQKRYEQAVELSKFIDQLQDTHPDVRLVVIGDFNAFEFTDGYVDVMGQVTGRPDPAGALLAATDEISQELTNQTLNMPADQRYSFVFDGTAQSLDHAITSQGLDPFVRGARHTRGNADAPFDYDEVADTALRSSDHDGTVIFLTTDLDADSVPDNLDACEETRIPEGVPTLRLNPNHYALVDGDRQFDTTAPPGRVGRMPSFSIAEMAGCSCEQILDRVATLEAGERKFGCSVETMKNWTER